MSNNTVTDFESKIPGVKITELKQLLSNDINKGKTIILIEGSDDKTFYVRYVSEPNVVFSVLNGCYYMPDILCAVKKEAVLTDRVIGIKDADFDRILGKNCNLDSLFLTDTHDWETMTLTEECERNVTIEALGRTETGVFSRVMSDLKNYSYLKLYNVVEICKKGKEGISFQNFSIANIYDGNEECKIDKCIKEVKAHNNNCRHAYFPNKSDIEDFRITYPKLDLYQFTCGHDVIQGVVQLMIHLNGKGIEVGEKETARIFRTSFTKEMFMTTQLYKDIASWSLAHHTIVWAA